MATFIEKLARPKAARVDSTMVVLAVDASHCSIKRAGETLSDRAASSRAPDDGFLMFPRIVI